MPGTDVRLFWPSFATAEEKRKRDQQTVASATNQRGCFFFFQRGWAFIMTCLTAKQKKKDEERSKKNERNFSLSRCSSADSRVFLAKPVRFRNSRVPRVFGGFELLLTNRGIIKLPTGSTRDCHVQSFNRTAFRHPTLADPLSAHLQVHVS